MSPALSFKLSSLTGENCQSRKETNKSFITMRHSQRRCKGYILCLVQTQASFPLTFSVCSLHLHKHFTAEYNHYLDDQK